MCEHEQFTRAHNTIVPFSRASVDMFLVCTEYLGRRSKGNGWFIRLAKAAGWKSTNWGRWPCGLKIGYAGHRWTETIGAPIFVQVLPSSASNKRLCFPVLLSESLLFCRLRRSGRTGGRRQMSGGLSMRLTITTVRGPGICAGCLAFRESRGCRYHPGPSP